VSVFDLILQSSEGLKSCCLKHLLLKYSSVFFAFFFLYFSILFCSTLVLHAPRFLTFSFRGKSYSDPDAVWAQPQIVCLSFLSTSQLEKRHCAHSSVDFSGWIQFIHHIRQSKKPNKKLQQKNCLNPKQASLESVVQNVCGFLFLDLLQ